MRKNTTSVRQTNEKHHLLSSLPGAVTLASQAKCQYRRKDYLELASLPKCGFLAAATSLDEFGCGCCQLVVLVSRAITRSINGQGLHKGQGSSSAHLAGHLRPLAGGEKGPMQAREGRSAKVPWTVTRTRWQPKAKPARSMAESAGIQTEP